MDIEGYARTSRTVSLETRISSGSEQENVEKLMPGPSSTMWKSCISRPGAFELRTKDEGNSIKSRSEETSGSPKHFGLFCQSLLTSRGKEQSMCVDIPALCPQNVSRTSGGHIRATPLWAICIVCIDIDSAALRRKERLLLAKDLSLLVKMARTGFGYWRKPAILS